jgi:Holliday junction DNA helicase RuvB
LDLLIDNGPSARSVKVNLNKFTLVAATTRSGLLSSPLRSRFFSSYRLDYYTPEILQAILLRSATILGISMTADGAKQIALRSRGTPRVANNLLRWVRDFAQTRAQNRIDEATAEKALKMIAIDEKGLDEMDKKLLSMIIDHYEGGPVGVKTLAVGLGEEEETLAEVYEPYLIMQGFLKRTPRGREVTALAYTHLGRPIPNKFGESI